MKQKFKIGDVVEYSVDGGVNWSKSKFLIVDVNLGHKIMPDGSAEGCVSNGGGFIRPETGPFNKTGSCIKYRLVEEDYTPKDIQDPVNSPAHYGQGTIEAIEYIEDFLTEEEYIGYLRGNIAKYMHRWRYKNGVEDLKKAQWYLNKLIETQE